MNSILDLDNIRKSFGLDVAILSKYHPIEEVGLRAFDNNKAAIKAVILEIINKHESNCMSCTDTAKIKEEVEAL